MPKYITPLQVRDIVARHPGTADYDPRWAAAYALHDLGYKDSAICRLLPSSAVTEPMLSLPQLRAWFRAHKRLHPYNSGYVELYDAIRSELLEITQYPEQNDYQQDQA